MFCVQDALILTAMLRLKSWLKARNSWAYCRRWNGDNPASLALRETMDFKAKQLKATLKVAHVRSLNCGKFYGIHRYRSDTEWMMLDSQIRHLAKEYRRWQT